LDIFKDINKESTATEGIVSEEVSIAGNAVFGHWASEIEASANLFVLTVGENAISLIICPEQNVGNIDHISVFIFQSTKVFSRIGIVIRDTRNCEEIWLRIHDSNQATPLRSGAAAGGGLGVEGEEGEKGEEEGEKTEEKGEGEAAEPEAEAAAESEAESDEEKAKKDE